MPRELRLRHWWGLCFVLTPTSAAAAFESTGTGSFVLGPLPTGVTAEIATNTVNNSIDLVITAVVAPRWSGTEVGGVWDINQTPNWTELSTGLPTLYNDGLVALFDDAALGTTTVDLVTTVQPGGVVVNNNSLAYTFTGTGKISGATGLTKRGTNTLTIANLNDYTGPTVIMAGTVRRGKRRKHRAITQQPASPKKYRPFG